MINWHTAFLSVVLITLTACSTAVTTSNEYLLMDVSSYKKEGNTTAVVSVQLMPIVVANYLGGNEIVLVSKQGEVHRSQSNLWAEPLAQQLTRLTQQHLEKTLPKVTWFGRQRLPTEAISQLSLEVDTFYADLDGIVHISGRWHLISSIGETIIIDTFQIQDTLLSDGYPTMVKTLAKNWFENVIDPMSEHLAETW